MVIYNGAKVKVNLPDTVYDGLIGTVMGGMTASGQKYVRVLIDEDIHLYYPEDVEIIGDEMTIKIGDKIRILEDRHACADVREGDILSVDDFYTKYEQEYFMASNGEDTWSFTEDCEGYGFELVKEDAEAIDDLCELRREMDVIVDKIKSTWTKEEKPQSIDSHYDFYYDLSEFEAKYGQVKVDPYFVSRQWRVGARDTSGALFHILKTIARFGDKNPKEREIKAIYLQIKRLAELENVELE